MDLIDILELIGIIFVFFSGLVCVIAPSVISKKARVHVIILGIVLILIGGVLFLVFFFLRSSIAASLKPLEPS